MLRDGPVRPAVAALVADGPLPDEDASVEEIEHREQQLVAAEALAPLLVVEARALLAVFGPDLCYGPNDTLIHLVETCGQDQVDEPPPRDANLHHHRLWRRSRVRDLRLALAAVRPGDLRREVDVVVDHGPLPTPVFLDDVEIAMRRAQLDAVPTPVADPEAVVLGLLFDTHVDGLDVLLRRLVATAPHDPLTAPPPPGLPRWQRRCWYRYSRTPEGFEPLSYELAVWFSPRGLTLAEADAHYERLCGSDTVPSVDRVDPRVAALVAELHERVPTGTEAGPWSGDGAEVVGDGVIVSVLGSRSREVAPVVLELAERHGLVVLDPQERDITHPSVLREAATTVMWTADGSQREDPDETAVRLLLDSVSPRNWHAVLERGESYVQTAWCAATRVAPEHYDLEYRDDGDPDRHVRVEVRDPADLVAAFVGFARGDEAWRQAYAWERLDLAATET